MSKESEAVRRKARELRKAKQKSMADLGNTRDGIWLTDADFMHDARRELGLPAVSESVFEKG